MPRKKRSTTAASAEPASIATAEELPTTETASATAVAESGSTEPTHTPIERPAWIDGPPTNAAGEVMTTDAQPTTTEPAKNWGDPYKTLFTCREKGFEMGENRRFRQRVFKFAERPGDDVLARLKDAGFSYRAAEKAWTIQATPDSRKLSDELAREFAGANPSRAR